MNGIDRFLLDTNAIVSLLRNEKMIQDMIQSPQWIGISIVSYLEFLSFPHLSEFDRQLFIQFIKQIEIVGLEIDRPQLLQYIIDIRKRYRLKLPDAIIAATAVCTNAALVTADRDFQPIQEISVFVF